MSFPQFQSAADYLGAMADSDDMKAVPSLDDNQGAVLNGPVLLNFMGFDTVGSVVTCDSNHFAPASTSTGRSFGLLMVAPVAALCAGMFLVSYDDFPLKP